MIQATNRFVWVKRDEALSESGGLYIPESGRIKPHSGTIVTLGDTIQDKKIKFAKGKKCLWMNTNGFDIEFEGETYLILTDDQIIGIV